MKSGVRNVLATLLATPCLLYVLSANAQRERGPDPTVDINNSQERDHLSTALRRQRNQKHNLGAGRPLEEPKQQEAFDGGISATLGNLPAIPVFKSDAVVVGTVTDAAAHLSDARDFVYSEFRIRPENILKSGANTSLNIGQYIDAERSGGAVRFPSGKFCTTETMVRASPRRADATFSS
jgi:hypothetical protein